MVIGLIVGKFAPLHAGHEYAIREAMRHCDKLIILSYTSEYSNLYPDYQREFWLKATFPTADVHVVPAKLNDDDDAYLHREFCYDYLFNTLHTSVQKVFGSDDYIYDFADHLSHRFRQHVTAVSIDQSRIKYPISGTELRNNPEKRSQFLNFLVYYSIKPSIAILGGESSGKTTLAEALAERLEETYIPEYGRQFYDEAKGVLHYEDMLRIAEQQVLMEQAARPRNYLITDTTPLTTAFYSQQLFNNIDPKLQHLSERQYTFTVLLGNDIPFIQDGTRKDIAFRDKGYDFYNQNLISQQNYRKTKLIRTTGSVQSRVNRVLDVLKTSGYPIQ